MGQARYASQEIVERGRRLYEERIRQEVEAEHRGQFLVIDVETGDYEVDSDHLTASNGAAARHPGAPLYSMRIGYPSIGQIGGRRAAGRP